MGNKYLYIFVFPFNV